MLLNGPTKYHFSSSSSALSLIFTFIRSSLRFRFRRKHSESRRFESRLCHCFVVRSFFFFRIFLHSSFKNSFLENSLKMFPIQFRAKLSLATLKSKFLSVRISCQEYKSVKWSMLMSLQRSLCRSVFK